MSDDLLDLALLFEVCEGLAGKASVDLESVDKRRNGDETVGLYVFVELVGCRLVEDDGVLGFVLN